jgi:hypothetical protein
VSLTAFAGIVAAILSLSLAVSAATLATRPAQAVGAGALLAGLNALAAYGLVLWSRGRSTGAFMKAVLGGLTLRLLLMLAAVVVALRVLGLAELPFVASLLGHFVLFLVLELWQVQRGAAATSGAAS